MSFLRFLILLSLVVWVGALIFFPVLAQTSFSVLPSRSLAGLVVGHSLVILQWMGIVSGLVFLFSSIIYSRLAVGVFRPLTVRNLLIFLMLVITLVSQFGIIPRMNVLRASISGEVDSVPLDDPARRQFDALHAASTRLEEGALLMGLLVVYLTARASQERSV